MASQNTKIMKALAKIKKKSKKVKKVKRVRKSRATNEMKQIVNIKGLGGLGSKPQQPFIFQAQREGPVSSSQDFFISALKQLNRVNAPSESIQEVKENMNKLERDLGKQAMTNKQLILESNLLKNKYANIQSRTDNEGDFSQPSKLRNYVREQQLFQDRSTLTPKRGNAWSEESKAKARDTRARNKALKEQSSMATPAPMMSSSLPEEPEPEPETIDYETRRDIRLSDVVKKSGDQDIFI